MCGPWSQQVMEQILSMERQQQQQQPTLLAQMPPPISLHVLPSQEPTSQEAWHTHTHSHTNIYLHIYIHLYASETRFLQHAKATQRRATTAARA